MDHVGKPKASNSDLTTIDDDMERTLSGVGGGAELHVRGMQRMLARTSHEHFGVEETQLEERREVCKAWNSSPSRSHKSTPCAQSCDRFPVCCRSSCFDGSRSTRVLCMCKACTGCPGPRALCPAHCSSAFLPQSANLLSCLERGWLFAFGNAATRRGHTRASRSLHRRSRQVARLPTAVVLCRCCSSSACSRSQTLPYNMPLTL